MSIKKIIGKYGRKYGGKPFQIIRGTIYAFPVIIRNISGFYSQIRELGYLKRGEYLPTHPDKKFYDNYYSGGSKDIKKKKGEPAMIVCLCDGRMFHGGPTDRLRGILTTYREAKRSGIPFYISWRSPFNLEDYYIPAGFDWRIDPDKLIYDKRDSFPLIIEDEPNLYAKWRIKRGVKINVSQLHVYSNADNARGEYSELFREVFRPSEALQKEVDIHLEKLGPRFHAFTFRFLQLLGDFKDWYQVTLPEEERIRLMDKVVDEFHKLISKIPEGYKILVTSDSSRFLQRIKNEDERIYIVPGEVKNIDLLKGEHQGAWMKTFVDQQLLMHAEKVVLMRTGDMFKSGFPRFAAEVGGAQFIDHKF